MRNINKWLLIPYSIVALFILLPMLSLIFNVFSVELQTIKWLDVFSAIWISLKSSLWAMLVVVVVGTPTAYVKAKVSYPGKRILERIIQVPMVLPPAVTGLMLLITFGRNGFIGRVFGVSLAFSPLAIVLIYVFIGLPVYIDVVSQGFKNVSPLLIKSAMSLGDTPLKAFLKVTLPLSKDNVKVGFLMAWAKGLGEFGATMLFAGNIKGITQTLPLAIYSMMETNLEASMLLSIFMMIIGYLIIYISKKGDINVSN